MIDKKMQLLEIIGGVRDPDLSLPPLDSYLQGSSNDTSSCL